MNHRIKKILFVYLGLIFLLIIISVFFLIKNSIERNNIEKSNQKLIQESQSEINQSNTDSSENTGFNQNQKIDPISGLTYVDNPVHASSLASESKIVFYGPTLLLDKTSISPDNIRNIQDMYSKFAEKSEKNKDNPMVIKIYKESFESSQEQTSTYTKSTVNYKTQIDGKDYYNVFTYDSNKKIKLTILQEDKTTVVYEEEQSV